MHTFKRINMTQWYRNRCIHEKNVYTASVPLGKNILFPTSTAQLYVSTNPHFYNCIPEEKWAVIALNSPPFSESPETVLTLSLQWLSNHWIPWHEINSYLKHIALQKNSVFKVKTWYYHLIGDRLERTSGTEIRIWGDCQLESLLRSDFTSIYPKHYICAD